MQSALVTHSLNFCISTVSLASSNSQLDLQQPLSPRHLEGVQLCWQVALWQVIYELYMFGQLQHVKFMDELPESHLPTGLNTFPMTRHAGSVPVQCLQEGCKSELAKLTLRSKNAFSKSQTLTACRLDCAAYYGKRARQNSIIASSQRRFPSNA